MGVGLVHTTTLTELAKRSVMAAKTSQLPVIGCVRVSPKGVAKGEEDGKMAKDEEVAAFLASVRLGSLQRQSRPGDIFRPSRHASVSNQRPLGLIPDRGAPSSDYYGGLLPPIFPTAGLTSSVVCQREIRSNNGDNTLVTFRHPPVDSTGRHAPSAVSRVAITTAEDAEYADTLAKCKMKDYVSSEVNVSQTYNVTDPLINRHRRTKTVPEAGTKLRQCPNFSTGPTEYFSFINQANMSSKLLYLDQRHAAECEECERCRGRRGRCSRCLAIRVGGGYIILDGGELPHERRGSRNTDQFKWTGRGRDERHLKNEREFGSGLLMSDRSHVTGNEGGWGSGDGDGDVGKRGGGDLGEGRGVMRGGGWGEGGRERHSGDLGYDPNNKSMKGGMQSGRDDHDGRGEGYGGRSDGNDEGRGGGEDGSRLWDGDGTDSGQQNSLSQRPSSGSRPGSRVGMRPPSSMKRHSRTGDHRKKGVNIEHQSGGEGRGGRGGGEGEDGEDGDGRRSRRRKRGEKEGEDKEDGDGGGRSGYGYHHHDDNLEAAKSGSLGDLMRFRSKKKDDVKVLKATLKELQDIDPLDYLAKYCIIDQNKVPHYRRVYDNVDRDEDDEIDIFELDFALKAVNFDLISDSELSYVHSVLELAGRHKLNFRYFSLIAALSEKVVALDDMVKRLINKMDFEALEVKLKKCKELFYLLADTEHNRVEQGGVVTVSSLAVELQAGGLTQEHVDYVCDHMNHEDRGLVEFLDYLTYVPLFVEIHDNIYDNPLDFTRTK